MNSEHENSSRLRKFVIGIPIMVFTLTTYLKFNKYAIVSYQMNKLGNYSLDMYQYAQQTN